MLSLFAQAQQNGVVEYMYIHRNNGLVDSVAVAEIESVTFATPTVRTQYEAVDLGLSVKWASFNVGATSPEEYGGYYAWGETEEKEEYSWSNYKWSNGSGGRMTKYCTDSYDGAVDNKTILEPDDDVANVKWGGDWRMPTYVEFDELRNNCTWTWTIFNGVNGYIVTGPNGNSIFLPAAGYNGGNNSGSWGCYWSSSLFGNSGSAYGLHFSSSNNEFGNNGRCSGSSVRPVCGEAIAPIVNYTVSVSSDENGAVAIYGADVDSATVADGATVTITARANEGYEFIGWFVGDNETAVSTDAEYTFTVSESVVLVAKFERRNKTYINGYEYIDLGLPSGIKWARHNVGATNPEEYGGYYAWGETEEKENYEWSTYKWCNGDVYSITKYCIYSDYGTVDNKTVLDPEDDVATVKWGGGWRMPTLYEQKELFINCTWTWTAINGVNGYIVTGPNGNCIFLPAAGIRYGTDLDDGGSRGDYWSSSLGGGDSNGACILCFNSDDYSYSYFGSRYCGFSVRPVCSEAIAPVINYTVSVSSDENGAVAIDGVDGDSATVTDGTTVTVTATANDGYEFIGWFVGDAQMTISTDAEFTFAVSENVVLVAKFKEIVSSSEYEAVDLGLPSGIRWASHNVGATKPEEYGDYYAWGEIEEKEEYSWSTYKWCNGYSFLITKYNTNSMEGAVDGKTALELEDDVANVKWGGSWRIPTKTEQDELRDNCTWTWTTLNGVNGYIVTGPNGNSIFLPAAGCRTDSSDTGLYRGGSLGYYWSRSLLPGEGNSVYYLLFESSVYEWNQYGRCSGLSVRPVCGTSASPVANVSVSSDGNGVVAINGAYVESVTVVDGASVTVTVTANDGYEFIGWFVGDNETAVSTDAKYTFTVSEDIVLVAKFERRNKTYMNGYEYIDLGLPSGIKWATCNVGATKPEEYGGYYAWGETEVKVKYDWSNYKWCNGTSKTLTKYCRDDYYGTVDNKTTLEPEDDVAHVKWGGGWRMPTEVEEEELRTNCIWTLTAINGVNGYTVTGPNGNCIFLPAAGYRYGTDVYSRGSEGYCWLSSLDGDCYYANRLNFRSDTHGWDSHNDRCYGHNVRPVCRHYTVSVSSDENGAVTIDGADVESATVAEGVTVTVTATVNDGYVFIGWFVGDNKTAVSTDAEYTFTVSENVVLVAKFKKIVSSLEEGAVDLGLPSGIKWASHNVGATKPEEYGGYYAWGETKEKVNYDLSTYKWCNGSGTTMTKYCTDSYFGTVDNKTTLDLEDDVAHVKWGGSWRMPTLDEQKELLNNCTWTWATLNGVDGYNVTGPNGNSIFLPAAGGRDGTSLYNSGSNSYYWSSSLYDGNSNRACYLVFYGSNYDWKYNVRSSGYSVRPVCSGSVAPVANYTVSVSSDENGAVVIYGADGDSATIADGATITVTATANDGYEFIGWFVGDVETPTSTDAEYTFTVSHNIVLVARFEQIQQETNGYKAVDLGLSVKWASFNVGATKPEEYGGYYAWGETEEKEKYSISTYKWCNNSYKKMTKYCTNSDYGTVDNKTTLDLEDDVAHVKWGGSWRMPTQAEVDELCNNCTWTWTTLNGVQGYTVTGSNGNSIFLPTAGYRNGTSLYYNGRYGGYWSSSLASRYIDQAFYLYFDGIGYDLDDDDRYTGYSVRPVCE